MALSHRLTSRALGGRAATGAPAADCAMVLGVVEMPRRGRGAALGRRGLQAAAAAAEVGTIRVQLIASDM